MLAVAYDRGMEEGRIRHRPVLLDSVLRLLDPQPGHIFVDATVGLGGHAEAILERIYPSGRLVAIDRDAESLELARRRLARFGPMVSFHAASFARLEQVLQDAVVSSLDGALADLGVSLYQLLSPERGFSFQREGPLDMRMDRSQELTAADLVNRASERELADIIYRYGEERRARRIARAIVEARRRAPIQTTLQLSEIVERAAGGRRGGRIHPATRTFQALRIAVNRELQEIEPFLGSAVRFLKSGARLAVISFHSLEDRIVKHTLRQMAKSGLVRILTRRPLWPSAEEIADNPRARSARLRCCEKI